jgi:hypothetical protein
LAACRSPGAHRLLAQAEDLRGDDGTDASLLGERITGDCQQPRATVIVLGQRAGDLLDGLNTLKQVADALLLRRHRHDHLPRADVSGGPCRGN